MRIRVPALAPWQRNLWSIVLVEVMVISAFQTGAVLIPYYIQELGVESIEAAGTWTGAYQSLGSISFAIFTPIWGAVGDRYGRKLMLLRAMAGTAVAIGLNGLVRTPSQLLVLRVVQGAFSGTPAAASAILAAGSPRNRLGYSLGLLQTALFVGSSLGPMLGGYIGDIYGYRAAFHFAAVIVVVATALVVVLVREPESGSLARSAGENPIGPLRAFRQLVHVPAFVLLTIATLLGSLTFGIISPVLPLVVQTLVGDPRRLASTAGAVAGAVAFSSAISALIIGRLSDRLGHRRVLLVASLGTGLLYAPQGFARTVLSLGMWRALQGAFRGAIGPSLGALVVGSAGQAMTGAALGLNSSAGSIGFAIGPMLGAALMRGGNFAPAFAAATVGAMLVPGIVILATAQAETAGQRTVEHEP